MRTRDVAISEVADEVLILAILIGIAAVATAVFLGYTGFLQKSAYVVMDFSDKSIGGKSLIAVFHRAGDPVYLTTNPSETFQAGWYIDTLDGSFTVEPAASLSVFSPGDTTFVYYTGSGYGITGDLSGVSYASLPAGILNLRLVDENSHVLLAQMNKSAIVASKTPATTITTINTTLQTTIQTTATPASSYAIAVSWSPLGIGDVTPPGGHQGSAVTVPLHGSQSFVCTPNVNKAVLSIKLDGATVYSGSSQGTPVTYTVNNVVSNHTLAVAFG